MKINTTTTLQWCLSLKSLCGSVVECQRAMSQCLRFHFSQGVKIFSLSHTHHDKIRKTFSLYTLNSVCKFSILFFVHFLRWWKGEFVWQSRAWIMAVNIWKSYMCAAAEETNIEAILTAMNTNELVAETRHEKNSGLYGIWTHNLCNTGAVLYQLS